MSQRVPPKFWNLAILSGALTLGLFASTTVIAQDSSAASKPVADSAAGAKAKHNSEAPIPAASSVPDSTVTEESEEPTNPYGELTEDQAIQLVLSRFAFAATPSLIAEVKERGLREWFAAQLKGDIEEHPKLQASLDGLEYYNASLTDLHKTLRVDYRKKIQEAQKAIQAAETPKAKRDAQQKERELKRATRMPEVETITAVVGRAIHSRNTLKEVSSDFFRNHFAIDMQKTRAFVADYEREVITENALGNFGDMLDASARHPAMLTFLDNRLSRRPLNEQELKVLDARKKRQIGRIKDEARRQRVEARFDIESQRGLNENYARELLELHTLGVDNYYTQDDVIEVARALTGWTVSESPRQGKPWTFAFIDRAHDAGDRTILGREIKLNEENPEATGQAVLDMLKAHQGTAEYLAFKLCRHFVNDNPSDEMVARIAKVWSESKGDLPTVYMAIFGDPEFFTLENLNSKYRRPFEFVIAALQVTGAQITQGRALIQHLQKMNENLYRCPDPTGYYDQAEAWKDPGAMALRWDFALDLTKNKIAGIRIPLTFYAGLRTKPTSEFKDFFAAKVLPFGLSERTSAAIDRFVEAETKKIDELKGRGRQLERKKMEERYKLAQMVLGALLGSPEFQKQ